MTKAEKQHLNRVAALGCGVFYSRHARHAC